MASAGQKMKLREITGGFAVFILGVVVTIFLWWFFGGLGFWSLPGFALMLAGLGEILYKVYSIRISERSSALHGGMLTFFIGIAMYFSFASHVMLGMLQIISLAVMVMGIIAVAVGMLFRHKT